MGIPELLALEHCDNCLRNYDPKVEGLPTVFYEEKFHKQYYKWYCPICTKHKKQLKERKLCFGCKKELDIGAQFIVEDMKFRTERGVSPREEFVCKDCFQYVMIYNPRLCFGFIEYTYPKLCASCGAEIVSADKERKIYGKIQVQCERCADGHSNVSRNGQGVGRSS